MQSFLWDYWLLQRLTKKPVGELALNDPLFAIELKVAIFAIFTWRRVTPDDSSQSS